MGMMPCIVAGCGPGNPHLITPQVRLAVEDAEVLAGTTRLLDLFPKAPGERVAYEHDLSAFLENLAPHLGRKAVVVLVSGDPGLASLAGTLARHFKGIPFQRLPGISSLQMAFAEAGLDWMDAWILRGHSTLPPWNPAWEGHAGPFAILTGDPGAPTFIANLARRLGRSALWRCERLGLEGQTITRLDPTRLETEGCDPLSVLIIEGAEA